jgi:branched-chain amino acid transport system permease protein
MAMAIALFALAVRIFHDTNRFFPSLFGSLAQEVGDVRINGQIIMAFFGAVAVAVTLWAMLTYTRLGVILRAVSSRPITAELMGVRTTWFIVGVWALAGALTTWAVILVAPARSSIPNIVSLVIPALAAAIFGAMRSFTLTIVGGVLIGMLESVALEWGFIGNYKPTLSFLMISIVLLWSQRKETWSDAR